MPLVEGKVPDPSTRCGHKVADGNWGTRKCSRSAVAFVLQHLRWPEEKDVEIPMCGLHAQKIDEEEKEREARSQKRLISDEMQNYVYDAINRLEKLGIKAAPYHKEAHKYNEMTGEVVVNPRELLEKLEK